MFETAEVGHTVAQAAFEKQARQLQAQLLDAQRRLRDSGLAVAVVVSGL